MSLDEIVRGYVECALWTGEFDNYTAKDLSSDAKEKMRKDCEEFYNKNKYLVDEHNVDGEHFGHDLWLSRNGHGTGFFDGDYGKECEPLQSNARKMGECYLYMTHLGQIEAN